MSQTKQSNACGAADLPVCPICHQPVKLESSKTDEDGTAVHERCYVESICSQLHDGTASSGQSPAPKKVEPT